MPENHNPNECEFCKMNSDDPHFIDLVRKVRQLDQRMGDCELQQDILYRRLQNDYPVSNFDEESN